MDFADAFAQIKAELGAESRQSKATIKLNGEEQLANWRSQMTPEECESLEMVNVKGGRIQDLLDRQEAESIAISHLFERSSVARELHAAAMLLRRGLGRVNVAEALDFARKDGRFMRPCGLWKKRASKDGWGGLGLLAIWTARFGMDH